ncbi:uncharacterized protein JCM15063_006562 [Sporobolomyces koalae]|uniref:uncharacterized protein n=1 Tax=Sporobolomyces koalae TaxID=500713 RepID=UPI0031788011
MYSKTPRRRQTLPYTSPSPASSIDSVSTCSSFDSLPSSPTTPAFATEFSHEPRTASDFRLSGASREEDASMYTIPPPTAQFFHQRVHRPPKPFTKREEWQIWYSANFGSNLLEPWENILIHALFLSILLLTYVALYRILSLSSLARIGARLRFYATGVMSKSSTLVA